MAEQEEEEAGPPHLDLLCLGDYSFDTNQYPPPIAHSYICPPIYMQS